MQFLYGDITEQIIGAAFEVHRVLGYGFLEKVYQRAMQVELLLRGLRADIESKIKVHFKDCIVGDYSADLLVNDVVIVELKAVSKVLPIHKAQLLSYLKLSRRHIGLLINLHVARLKDGITRLAN